MVDLQVWIDLSIPDSSRRSRTYLICDKETPCDERAISLLRKHFRTKILSMKCEIFAAKIVSTVLFIFYLTNNHQHK